MLDTKPAAFHKEAMEKKPQSPKIGARNRRLGLALKANLARRKAQALQRKAEKPREKPENPGSD